MSALLLGSRRTGQKLSGMIAHLINRGAVMTRPAAISDVERARRAEAIRQATGSVELEGFTITDEVRAIDRRFIEGELNDDEYREEIFKLCRAEYARLAAERISSVS
ncbi:antitoxin VbhA family protein [Acetobacter estunensis]|uniref:antitoxin VbhA family protein n=1 Tax=Acetobacter estunensis TaxID=104097 RepID=UPI001C2DC7BE|nr:antitoxin VbhA family protein [Acetobacter estunensis]MBV1838498.1 antitoxin VbhA family protein [Acetobacter estunensis]